MGNLKWYNVFVMTSKKTGQVKAVWDKGRRYDSEEEAKKYSNIAPDAGFEYIETRSEEAK